MKKLVIFLIVCFFSCKNYNEKNQTFENEKPNTEGIEKSKDTIIWFTELCEMKSSFDATKLSKKQLKDTYKLWFNSNTYIDFDGYPVFDLDKKTEPLEKLESKYLDLKSNIENLEIVDLPYWQNLKNLKLLELKSYYDFEKVAFNAYKNLSLLKNTKYNPKAKIYVDALVSGDSVKIITAWKTLNEEKKSNNGSPEYLEQEFQIRLKSQQCLEYAKMDLFTFGWANHVNKSCEDCKLLERQDIMMQEYQKLFTATTEECDEP